MVPNLTLKQITIRFKKEFKDYDFDNKSLSPELVMIRRAYYYLTHVIYGYSTTEVSKSLLSIKTLQSIRTLIKKCKELKQQGDESFNYFLNRAIDKIPKDYEPLSKSEKKDEYYILDRINSNRKGKRKVIELDKKTKEHVLSKALRTQLRDCESIIDNTCVTIAKETGIKLSTVNYIVSDYWDKKEKELIKRVNN